MKLSTEQARATLRTLAVFDRLERKATDEIGWVALHFSVTPRKAKAMISAAKAMATSDPLGMGVLPR